MSIEKITRPYEFLARFEEDGRLAGAHVQFLESIVEDGHTLSKRLTDPLPVSLATEAGFPLADILESLHISALVSFDSAVAERDAKTHEAQREKFARETAEGELAAAQKESKELESLLAQRAELIRSQGAEIQHLSVALEVLKANRKL